jgi:hypothetical protein
VSALLLFRAIIKHHSEEFLSAEPSTGLGAIRVSHVKRALGGARAKRGSGGGEGASAAEHMCRGCSGGLPPTARASARSCHRRAATSVRLPLRASPWERRAAAPFCSLHSHPLQPEILPASATEEQPNLAPRAR